jgi:hypothetical protein
MPVVHPVGDRRTAGAFSKSAKSDVYVAQSREGIPLRLIGEINTILHISGYLPKFIPKKGLTITIAFAKVMHTTKWLLHDLW